MSLPLQRTPKSCTSEDFTNLQKLQNSLISIDFSNSNNIFCFKANPDYFYIREGNDGKALHAAHQLIKTGQFSQFEGPEKWINFDFEGHHDLVDLAKRFFSNEPLKNLSLQERHLCNHFYNEHRKFELNQCVLNLDPSQDEALSKTKQLAGVSSALTKCARVVHGSLGFGECFGLIATDNMSMDLKEFQRIYPQEVLDNPTVAFLLKNSYSPLSQEVKNHLYSTFITNRPPQSKNLENVIQEQKQSESLSQQLIKIEIDIDIHESSNDSLMKFAQEYLEKYELIQKEYDKLEITRLEEVEGLKNEWNQKGEFYKKGVEFISITASALFNDFRERRGEKEKRFQINEIIKSHEDTRKDRKLEIETKTPHTPYNEVHLFIQDHYNPNGYMTNSLLDFQKLAKESRAVHKTLKKRINERLERQNSFNHLSQAIDKNDENFIKQIKEAIKAQQKMDNCWRTVSTSLSCFSAILCLAPGLNLIGAITLATTESFALAGATVTAGANISRIGQEVNGTKGDKLRRQLERHLKQSDRLQELLGRLGFTNQNELTHLNQDMQNLQNYQYSHSNQFTGKDNRRFLRKAIEDKTQKIRDLDEQKKICEEKLKELNDKIQKRDEYRKNHYIDSDKIAKHNAECLKDQTEKKELETLLEDAKNNKRALRNERKKDEEKLKNEMIIKPMKDQADLVILQELNKFDFERDKKGKLTRTGLLQQEMRISFARYNETRMQERQLVQNLNSSFAELANHFDYFADTKKFSMTVEFANQIYKIHDQVEHFKFAIPQLKNFIKSLSEDRQKNLKFLLDWLPDWEGKKFDKKSISKGVLDALHLVDTISGIVIPALKVTTAIVSAARLYYELRWREKDEKNEKVVEWDPETQYIVEVIQHIFQEHQKNLHKAFEALIKYIGDNNHHLQSHLQEDINELHSELVHATEILNSQIKNSNKEILDKSLYEFWKTHERKINKIEIAIRERVSHFNSTEGYNNEDITLNHISKLCSALKSSTDPGQNGLMITTDRNTTKFKLERISTDPDYFSGLFLSKIKNSPLAPQSIPNLRLYFEINKAFEDLKDKLKSSRIQIPKLLNVLDTELSVHKNNIVMLYKFKMEFVNQALSDKLTLENFVNKEFCIQKLTWRFQQENAAKCQLATLGPKEIQKFQSQFVCGEKYLISDLILNARPIDNVKLSLDNRFVNLSKEIIHSDVVGGSIVFGTASAIASFFVVGPGLLLVGPGFYLYGNFLNKVFNAPTLTDIEFYNRCETKVLNHMNTSLKNLTSKKLFANENVLKNYAIRMDHKAQLLCHYTASHHEKKSKLNECTLTVAKQCVKSDTKFNAIEKLMIEKPLLDFSIKYDFNTLSYVTTFDPNNIVQLDEINQIQKFDHATEQMKKNESTLLDCYVQYLNHLLEEKELSESNPFKKIEYDGELVPFLLGDQFPLLLPKKLLEKIDQVLFSNIVHLISKGKTSLIPYLDFKYSPTKDKYILSIHYQLLNQGVAAPKELCSFILATFDKGAVESFKKIDLVEGQDKKYTYQIGTFHLQEFLVQAMYAGHFEAPLPGLGTFKLGKEDLYIPNPKPFDGLFNLWLKKQTTINYDSRFYDDKGNGINLCETTLQIEYGKGYLSVMRELQSQEQLTDELQKLLKSYNESYHLCKGMIALAEDIKFDDSTPDNCKSILETIGLIAPEDTESLILNIFAKNNL